MFEKIGAAGMRNHEVHHRVPLEYSHLFGAEPNSVDNLVALPTGMHRKVINGAWSDFSYSFMSKGMTPSADDVTAFAKRVDRWYEPNAKRF